jgi:hypothetical protein
MTVSSNLIEDINSAAFATFEAEVTVEDVKIPVVENESVIKKIEDSNKFLTAEAEAKERFGVSPQAKTNYETTRTESVKSYSGYSSSTGTYGKSTGTYGYSYSQPVKETPAQKAAKEVVKTFDRVKLKVDTEFKNQKPKSNWDVLQIMDEERVLSMGKQPKKTPTKADTRGKVNFINSMMGLIHVAKNK